VNIDWLELHNDSFLQGSDETPRAAYYGVQMAHLLLNPRDSFVSATSNQGLLIVHAARRNDGKDSLLLINEDPKNEATVQVKMEGDQIAPQGKRFDWGKGAAPIGNQVQMKELHDLGNRFSVRVPAYTATVLLLDRTTQ
jgi:hypothetical protein